MLELTLDAVESYDEANNEFVWTGGTVYQLEHSLVSLSKWEQKFKKAFLGRSEKDAEEALGYLRCMVVSPEPPPDFVSKLTDDHVTQVNAYLTDASTATTFGAQDDTPSREVITSEIIYYWMTALHVPFECETWNLHRLFALIQVISIKNAPKKTGQAASRMANAREMNLARRAQHNTKG